MAAMEGKVLSVSDLSEINRALGVLEGLTYGVDDDAVANGIAEAIERIDHVINREPVKEANMRHIRDFEDKQESGLLEE